MKIKDLSNTLINTNVIVNGWVLNARFQRQLTFIKLVDGSDANGLQIVCDFIPTVSTGTSISVKGLLVKSPSPEQPYELQCKEKEDFIVFGQCPPDEYPLAKSMSALSRVF